MTKTGENINQHNYKEDVGNNLFAVFLKFNSYLQGKFSAYRNDKVITDSIPI